LSAKQRPRGLDGKAKVLGPREFLGSVVYGDLRRGFPGPLGLPGWQAGNRGGQPIISIREGFAAPGKQAGIKNFAFWDFPPGAINNWRLQGHDYCRIMAATGHQTLNMGKGDNTVGKDELKALVEEFQQ
jgi:hypothetical protein